MKHGFLPVYEIVFVVSAKENADERGSGGFTRIELFENLPVNEPIG
jgi:hypothetical protein